MTTLTADIAEIQHILKRERYHRDTAQWDLCRAAFHPDASKTYINVAWYEGDVENFLQQSAKMHKGKVNILHSSFDPVEIHVRGQRATSEAFCVITSLLTLDGVDYELASYMRLLTRLEKLSESGQWRMLSLESIYVRDRIVTAFPGSGSSTLTMSEEVQAYPKGYRHLALVMRYRGLKPQTNLPHEDDQEGVRELLDRNRAYLEGAE
ncbi:hypothetical protein V501_07760 [Pseudogymnoascus sp. VKM F-4519 (FW-2642)]|uniref:SnoaL-like domain-containing protein n=1 Tax=Pseudogymnoascus verrucosus TaxID=342668 RepID=A0A1B8GPK8_9PEZI|nr:uncharacterized protein VE01_05098 [Pseudogymnoascus verrucosus]KFY78183.1 hypothetical protein V499_02619 [Pseudogymnoascus sp. VKM F-103]KFZ06098.1 hypothetical protein V501_07760 [Pseudogymnoascus sp. VKM F-4519 (FW-2642)]OBT97752.1 hypothetical protein VE01_05098 [Pseudogymnoascus verrucosus]